MLQTHIVALFTVQHQHLSATEGRFHYNDSLYQAYRPTFNMHVYERHFYAFLIKMNKPRLSY